MDRTRYRGSRRARHGLLFLLGCLVLPASPAPATGQQPEDPAQQERGSDRERLEQRIRARIAQIMRERLELAPAQEEALSAIAREFEGRRRELGRLERDLRQRADSLLEGEISDAQAEELLAAMVRVRHQEAALFEEEQTRLLEVLTPAKVLEFHELRREIGERIRAIRERRSHGGPGDGGADGEGLARGHDGPGVRSSG